MAVLEALAHDEPGVASALFPDEDHMATSRRSARAGVGMASMGSTQGPGDRAGRRLIVSAVRPNGVKEYVDLDKRDAAMRIYDGLGPLTRRAIDESPIDIEPALLLQAFKGDRGRAHANAVKDALMSGKAPPAPPALSDAEFAAFIEASIRCKVPGYTPLPRPRQRMRRNGR